MITEIESRYENPLKKNLYFVRHAQSEANVSLTGGGDPTLTRLGVQQAKYVGLELKQHLTLLDVSPVAFVHTGSIRSRQTLEKISEILGNKSAHIEMTAFRERGLGNYEEKHLDYILQAPELNGLFEELGPSCVWFLKSEDKGVEPLSKMYFRIEEAIVDLQSKYEDLPVIVVGHAGSMKLVRRIYESGNREDLASYLAGFVPDNCEIYKLG